MFFHAPRDFYAMFDVGDRTSMVFGIHDLLWFALQFFADWRCVVVCSFWIAVSVFGVILSMCGLFPDRPLTEMSSLSPVSNVRRWCCNL